jgi:Flp pilus assembly protein TadB
MQNDFQNDNPKTIWQKQPTETSKMTLEELRHRARKLHSKIRRELFANIAVALIVVAVSGFGTLHTHNQVVRLLFVLAVSWALGGQYFLHRGLWSGTPRQDAELSTGLEFYRQQIEGRLSLIRRVLQWSVGPLVLSIGVLILLLTGMLRSQSQSVNKVIPFCTLFAIWLLAFFVLRSQDRRKLKREIDELNDFEKAGSRSS